MMREPLAAPRIPSVGQVEPDLSQVGQRLPGIDQPLHQDVEFPPEVAARHTHHGGQGEAYAHGAKAHGHRDTGAIDNTAKEVTSEIVGAEVELTAGRF